MPKAPINGIDLYYESQGKGPAIVFAHGAGGNHISWWQQVPEFMANHRCITFDHRGWGASIEPAGGPGRSAFVEDLRQLLDHLGVEKTFLVAQSMGGRTCLGFALAYPERTLAVVLGDTLGGAADPELTGPASRVPTPPSGPERTLSRGFIKANPDRTFLYQEIGGLNPERPNDGAPSSPDQPTAAGLGRSGIPTLLIVGEEDPICPPDIVRIFHGLVPGSSLEVVAGAAHSAHFEQPEIFNRLVGHFFASILSSQGAAVPAD